MWTVPRADLSADTWNAYVEAHTMGWWWHTSHWLDYSLAYNPDAVDHSFAVIDGNRVRAIVPYVQEGHQVSLGGIPAPGFLCDDEGVLDALNDHAIGLARAHGMTRFVTRGHPVQRIPDQVEISSTPGIRTDISWNTFVVDLTMDEDALFRNVRKSYRHLIRKAEQEREIIVTNDGSMIYNTCRTLHYAACGGRSTRPMRTWELMAEWANRGDAVVALITDRRSVVPNGFLYVGYAYAIRWKQWAYYASGATIEDDVAHALQWALIKALRNDDRRYYEVGWDVRPGESGDAKAAGIALFKSGFGGDRWTIVASDRRLS